MNNQSKANQQNEPNQKKKKTDRMDEAAEKSNAQAASKQTRGCKNFLFNKRKRKRVERNTKSEIINIQYTPILKRPFNCF